MDPGQFGELIEKLKLIGGTVGGAGALRWLFRFNPKDIPPCQTRIMRAGVGWPWDKQVALHPLKDGRLEITLIEVPRSDKERRSMATDRD